MTRRISVLLCGLAVLCGSASAQQVRYDDVVRNLRNPDPKIRANAVRLLRESKHLEAIGPIAPLVNDPVDEIQLEAIGAELSFYLVEDVPVTKRVALVVEVRNPGRAPAAFELGPLAAWPRPVPTELLTALLAAVDDENPKVRLEAIYTVGVIARPPLGDEHAQGLIKALDHYDPLIRAAVARVIGRLKIASAGDALIRAVNDSNADVRYASMVALGEVRELRALESLIEQLNYYGKGEGAWSALHALALIAHPSSVPAFKTRIADRDALLRRAAMEGLGRSGDRSEIVALEVAANNDSSAVGRAAAAFALQLLGRNMVARMVEFMASEKTAPQVAGYLMELGPAVIQPLTPHLLDQEPAIRANVAQVMGALGGPAALAALEPLRADRDRTVAQAAERAIARAKMVR